MSSFYSDEELRRLGFNEIGNNVKISRKASLYGTNAIRLGNNVRIDDFCILSGNIQLGNNVHIAAYVAIFAGNYGVLMEDYTAISSRSVIYAASDDYSGEFLTNPTIPEEYCHVYGGMVTLKKHVIVGTGSTIMPGVTIGIGTAVGCMSLVNKDLPEWGIYAGIPCRFIKERKRDVLSLEKKYIDKYKVVNNIESLP